jgi:hypothetical protein
VFVELLCRRAWARWFVVVVPAVIYAAWYLGYGEDVITREGLINSPGFAQDIAAAAFGAIAGHGLDWGRPIAVLGFAILAWRLTRPSTISARLAGLIATGLFLWFLTAAARSNISSPETGRYVYLGAVVIVLAGVELIRAVALSPRVLAVAALAVAIFAITGLTLLRDGAVGLRGTSKTVTAELGALEVAQAHAPAGYVPDPHLAPQILAGPYLHTIRAIGSSPADSPAAIRAAAPGDRAAADGVLLALEAPALSRLPALRIPSGGAAPAVEAISSGTASTRGGCTVLTPLPGTAVTAVLALPRMGLQIGNRGIAPAALAVRRFGDAFVALGGAVPAHTAAALTPAPDAASAVPWQLQLSSSSSLTACGA